PQKNASTTSGSWTRLQIRYSGLSRSLQYFEIGAEPACQSQRRCDHQKPPTRGLETSSGVSDFAWWSRWLAAHESGDPEPFSMQKNVSTFRTTGCSLTDLCAMPRWKATVVPRPPMKCSAAAAASTGQPGSGATTSPTSAVTWISTIQKNVAPSP